MMLGYKSNKNVVYSSKYHIVWCPKRSEEHTSELQSRLHLVCRLLLEKNKHKNVISSNNGLTLLCPIDVFPKTGKIARASRSLPDSHPVLYHDHLFGVVAD